MIAVWYDETCDQIWISGAATSYAPRSLVATRNGDALGVKMRSGTEFLVYSPFSMLTDRSGAGFLSADEAEAYLVATFARRPAPQPLTLSLTAGEPIGGQKAVRIGQDGIAFLASSDAPGHIGTVLGLAATAADEGAGLSVVLSGEFTEPSWSFSPGAVFLGLSGALVQAPPATAFVQQIGTALSATTLLIALSAPIVLAQ